MNLSEHKAWHPKKVRLFLVLGAFFIANALVAEFIGVKIFSAEATLGIRPMKMAFFGITELSFNMTAGVLLWPVVFVMTDLINEYFGEKGVRFFSWMAVILISYAFIMVLAAIHTEPADFWKSKATTEGNLDMQNAYSQIFGQGLWIIIGSLVAFLFGQLVDVAVFHKVKAWTGERFIWLRSTGSTIVSQLIDSFVVLFIAFYIGAGWSFKQVLAIALVNYLYKFIMALVMTPVIYLVHHLIERYLGKDLASQMRFEAINQPLLANKTSNSTDS